MFKLEDDNQDFWYRMDAAPLARAVADVAFPYLPELSTRETLITLRDELRADFDLQRSAKDDAVELAVGGSSGDDTNGRHVFQSEKGYELLVTGTNISLSQPGERYTDGGQFASMLESVLSVLRRVTDPHRYMRLGVRYVNAAPATVADWVAWFRPEFTGWIGAEFLPGGSTRGALQFMQITDDDEAQPATSATVRYGYLPNGIGPEITSRPVSTTPSFLADIDLASERGGEFKPDEIAALFRRLNHEIAVLFRYSLTEAGSQHFGVNKIRKTKGAST